MVLHGFSDFDAHLLLHELASLHEFALLHEDFSDFDAQPAALQPLPPCPPAKAGAAENAPIARRPAKAAVAIFLFFILEFIFSSHVI